MLLAATGSESANGGKRRCANASVKPIAADYSAERRISDLAIPLWTIRHIL